MNLRYLRDVALYSAMVLAGACGSGPGDDEVIEADLQLYVFDCGRIRFEDVTAFGVSNDETDIRELVVPCYVVANGGRHLLWDGGLPSSLATSGKFEGDGVEMWLDVPLAEQLAGIGIDMASFDFAAYSHMHMDHVGVANEVVGATVLIQRSEYEAAFADEVTNPVFDPALYSNIAKSEKILLDGDHDVFGDGRVRIVSAPGHTPGHQVLWIDLENVGPVVLSGDLYHLPISREERRVPQWNTDREQTLEAMTRVEALIEDTGATLWIEHDLATFENLDKAPAYYD